MSEYSGEEGNYARRVGKRRSLTRGQIAVKAAEVAAVLATVGGGVALLAKGIHDQQPELEARVDYNAANVLHEKQQQEVHHTKYFNQRREDDGYGYSNNGRMEVYNRINIDNGQQLTIWSEPSTSSERISGDIEAGPDGTVLGVPVYGDKWMPSMDPKDTHAAVFLKPGDKAEDAVGYYQRVSIKIKEADGKEKVVKGYLRETPDLKVVKSIKDPNRNQGVILADMTKK